MSESTTETQILVQSPIKEIPTFQVAEQKLKEAIDDPSLGIDRVLDLLEKDYIPSIETFNPHNFDSQIMLFTDLPKRMISDPNFSERVLDLPNANDQRLDSMPKFVKESVDLDDKGVWGHAEFRKFPEDQMWKRYWELVEKYSEKAFNIIKTDKETLGNYSGQTDEDRFQSFINVWWGDRMENYSAMLAEVKEKSAGKDLISSGKWLGHGTFLSNIERMIERGGKIKSTYHVLNSGGERQDIRGDIKGGDAHKAFIFFFHWKNESYKYQTDVVGKYGTQINGQVETSDVGVFYPVDEIYRNGLTIGSYLGSESTSEFFVTKTPSLISESRRFSKDEIVDIAKKDQTELPLDKAFFRVGDLQKYEDIKLLFLKFGHTEDWANDHIYFEKPSSNKDDLRAWLKSRPFTRVQIPQHRPVKYSESNYLWEPVK